MGTRASLHCPELASEPSSRIAGAACRLEAGLALVVTVALLTASAVGARSATPRSGSAPSHTETCAGSIQGLVAAASPGATIEVPACVYRESVVIDKPLTLLAEAGAEIRGTDIWTAWRREVDGWHGDRLPVLEFRPAECRRGDERCRWPEQVFRDEVELAQVDGTPKPGEFSVTGDREVVLGDDPQDHVIEVATRDTWVRVVSGDVRIEGFRMRGAVAPPQTGGITIGSLEGQTVSNVEVVGNDLTAAHGAVISVLGGRGHRIDRNRIAEAGGLGIALVRPAADVVVINNDIAGNNREGFDPGWEAGGIKALFQDRLVIEGNLVYDNLGRGIWTDTGTVDASIVRNRVTANAWAGIFVEASQAVTVEDNVAWGNGWDDEGAKWGFGGGITISSSDHVLVTSNVVAWNGDGITVLSQDRPDDRDHVAIEVSDNVVVQGRAGGEIGATYGLAWLADWRGMLFDPAAGNASNRNGIWKPALDAPLVLFAWDRSTPRLDTFDLLAPGAGDHYLTPGERNAALDAAGIPVTVPFAVQPNPRESGPAVAAFWTAAFATALLALGVVLLLARRHRARPPDGMPPA